MTDAPREDRADAAESLFAECLERIETEGSVALEALCAAHPDHAPMLRRMYGALARFGQLPGRHVVGEGMRIGGFRILRRLGSGGMGTVHLAVQESLGREVALKILHPSLADSATLRQRFEREARALARLEHPNLVTVYAHGEQDGLLYLAMQFLPGRTLDVVLRESRERGTAVPLVQLLRWGKDVAGALACAHAGGVVHRDVKPGNVMIRDDGAAVLLDFGLARDAGQQALTLPGGFHGSPMYAAPEQVRADGGDADRRTDVYGLGITLYEGIAGRPPFAAGTTERVFAQILGGVRADLRRARPGVSRELATVVHKAIAVEPADRYASAADFGADLDALLELRPVRASPPGVGRRIWQWTRRNRALAAATLLALLAVVAVPTAWLVAGARDRRTRQREAREALAAAQAGVREYAALRTETAEVERRVAELHGVLTRRWLEPDEDATLDREEQRVESSLRRRELLQVEVLSALARAQRLDPELGGVREVELALALEQWRSAENLVVEARTGEDRADARALADTWRARVELLDDDRQYGPELERRGALVLHVDPPDAELHLFRYLDTRSLDPAAPPRLVPVPHALPAGLDEPRAGAGLLRVTREAGTLASDDLILTLAGRPPVGHPFVLDGRALAARGDVVLAVGAAPVRDEFELRHELHEAELRGERPRLRCAGPAGEYELDAAGLRELGVEVGSGAELAARGGVAARIWHDGGIVELPLPPGLGVRATAAPLPCSPASRVTTGVEAALPAGDYVALARGAGRASARILLELAPGGRLERRITLDPAGDAPPEFVPIHVFGAGAQVDRYWLLDREVTAGEYLEFVNDPENQRRIVAGDGPRLLPRSLRHSANEAYWPRRGERWELPPDWQPDFPVLGISWHDACAYARWFDAKQARAGSRFRFDLPTEKELSLAARTAGFYVSGDRFRPKWVKSCWSRPRACVEPVLSYPIDETPTGLFDVAGSVVELTLDPFGDPKERERTAIGGAWAMAEPAWFTTAFWSGAIENVPNDIVGFRLVARRR